MKIRIPVQETDVATHIEVRVDYAKGQTNLLTGDYNNRGIWVYVSPIMIRDGFVSCVLFHGAKHLIERCARLNKNRLLEIERTVEAQIKAKAGVAWDMVLCVAKDEKTTVLEAVAV
jgi:hypothetical protein